MLTSRSPLVIALVLGGVVFSLGLKSRLLERSATSLNVRQEAPAFVLPDAAGKQFELKDTAKRNKLVLVTFWATWCAPCRIELAHLEQLYKDKAGRGLEILAINEDSERGKVDEYLKERPLSFPVLIDTDGAIAKTYGIEAFPTSALVDSNGRVLHVIDGVEPYLDTMIEYSLSKKPNDG